MAINNFDWCSNFSFQFNERVHLLKEVIEKMKAFFSLNTKRNRLKFTKFFIKSLN